MANVRLHARLLALLVIVLGGASAAWQAVVWGIPLTETETDPVWIVDARMEFAAREGFPVKMTMFLPPVEGGFITLNESFVSHNYGVNVYDDGPNRRAMWSARRPQGHQSLYYRLVLTRSFSETPAFSGPQYRKPMPLDGAEKLAVDALIKPIRERSADVETFISETIRTVNNSGNGNVRMLLAGDTSVESRARVADLILAAAHIPSEQVHLVRLQHGLSQEPQLWLRSFNGEQWLYFNPDNAQQGMPEDSLVWWVGPGPMVELEGGRNLRATITTSRHEMSAIQLAQTVRPLTGKSLWSLSLYDLPLDVQHQFRLMIMIPLGVLLILMLRNLVGLETLGTFTPVLVALAFRETDLLWGVLLFVLITALGLTLRAYLEHLRLQLLPRLSVVLTFVVMCMLTLSVLTHKMGLASGLSLSLFPMVILTMVIERMSIVWEERGGTHYMKVAAGTLVAAAACHQVMSLSVLHYLFFTFPGLLLVLLGAMLWMGHYRGYRLMELLRFRAMTEPR